MRGDAWKKSTMWIGLIASSTPGCSTIWRSPSTPMHREPHDHDRPEDLADRFGAPPLHDEQPDQDHAGQRDDQVVERRRGDLEALDRAEHRDGRRDEPVAVEQRGAEHAEQHQPTGAAAGRPRARHDQRGEGEDAALAVVVGPHDERQVLDRDDDDERPERDRGDARARWSPRPAGPGARTPPGTRRAGSSRCRRTPRPAHPGPVRRRRRAGERRRTPCRCSPGGTVQRWIRQVGDRRRGENRGP